MPGTNVKDAGATKLHNAVDISSATTTTGTGVQVGKPGRVRFRLTDAAITGADTLVLVEVQGCEVSDFSTGSPEIVSYGRFDTIDVNSDSVTRYLDATVYKDYVRAVTVTTGAAVVVNDLTVEIVEANYKRTTSDTA